MVEIMEMKTKRFILGLLLLFWILTPLLIDIQSAKSQIFTLHSYSYKSSAGTEEIYPGSRNVVLTINVLYTGDSTIYVSSGCIGLPGVFTVTRGYSSCVPPQTPNGTTYDTIHPGDLVVFNYHIDVSNNATPGVYEVNITIYYRIDTTQGSEVIDNIKITVSEYPALFIQIIDWYWNPAGYPGSENIYLYVTVKNTGNSRIVGATGIAKFNEEAFTPSTLRFQITNLEKNEFTTISLGPISIYPSASPNTSYQVILDINATMSTDDNVNYCAQNTFTFNITITPPPLVQIEIIDYGIETPKPVQNTRQARFYILLVNKDFKTIRSITAYFTITSPGATFINNSLSSVIVFQGVVNYGGVVSLYSDPLIISYVDYINISVRLVIFGDDNGAEFWSTLNYDFKLAITWPTIILEIINAYWSPSEVYPGTEKAALNIVFLNNDIVDVRDAVVSIYLPQGFYPRQLTVSNVVVQKGSMTTITFQGVSIDNTINPGTYPVHITIQGSAYDSSTNTYYTFTQYYTILVRVSKPSIQVEVIDYGIETPKPVQNTRQARFYILLVNKDFKTIRSITAYFTITSPGAVFINGTSTSIVVFQNPVNYGGIISINSDPLIIGNVSYIDIETRLIVFSDESGAEFWSTLNYTFRIPITPPSIDLEITRVYWSTSEVYPGSEGVALNIVFLNNDVVDVRDAVVTINLPIGFYPRQFTTNMAMQRGSMTTITFRDISLEINITPGEYPAQIIVQGVAYDTSTNTYYTFTQYHTVLVYVSETPKLQVLNMTSYGWIGDKAYTTSVNSNFYVYLQVVAPGYTIRGLKATAILPDQMFFTSGEKTRVVVLGGTYRYGDHIYLEFNGVNIVADKSNMYPVILRVEGLATGTADYWFTEYYTILLRVIDPELNITLIDASWTSSPVSSETSSAGLQITLQSLSLNTISSLVAKLILFNASFTDGRNYAVVTTQRVINYGEVFTLEFTGVEVNTTNLHALLEIHAVLTTDRSSYYRAYGVFNITTNTLEKLEVFRVIAIHTTNRGEYIPLLPSSRGVTISIELANTKPYQVTWVKVEISTPPEIIVNDATGTCSNGVTPGGTCVINLNIDLSSTTTPGVKTLELTLTYAVRTGQGLSVFTEKHRVNVVIANYEYYKPKLTLISAYWGVQTPIRAIIGQRNLPLTIIILNTGYYPVDGLYVEVKPINNTVVMVTNTSMCATRLATGTPCTVTLYTDLSQVNTTGILLFEITAKYTFTLYNTLIEDSQPFTTTLLVEESASGKGLLIVDASWSNNWPVYPGTENATLQVTLANMWPYRISGIQLEIELPVGFYSKTGNIVSAYVSGPINSLQEFTQQFTLSIGNIKPGVYTARLKTTYVVETGTPHTRVVEEYNITLLVNNPESSIQVVSIDWAGKAPEPPEYGVVLVVTVRNNMNPNMKGVILEVELPEGFLASNTNTSYIKTPASSVNILEQLQKSTTGISWLELPPQVIQEILSQVVSGTTQQGVFNYGDLMYFYLKLNIVTEKRGIFTFKGNLNFIDHWNNVRTIPIEFNVSLLGSTKLIEIQAPVSIRVVKGTSTLVLGFINTGSAPLYNVYVYLAPYSAMLIPQDNVKYIDTLPPRELVNVNYTLVYNPFAIATGGVQAYLRYMSVPFSLTILYRDVYGNTHYYNTTLAVLVEPFIDIAVTGVKATIINKTLSISGTIVNYGIAPARSVCVKATYGNYYSETLLGDLDPASQSAFRLELSAEEILGDNVVLTVKYRDEYGRVEEFNYTIKVTIVQTTETTPPKQIGGIWYPGYYIITSIAVLVFLSIVALMIYRYLKAHIQRSRES
jgi:hypothetical protein